MSDCVSGMPFLRHVRVMFLQKITCILSFDEPQSIEWPASIHEASTCWKPEGGFLMEGQLFSACYKICILCSFRCRVCISYLKVTVWRINEELIKTTANNNKSKFIRSIIIKLLLVLTHKKQF